MHQNKQKNMWIEKQGLRKRDNEANWLTMAN